MKQIHVVLLKKKLSEKCETPYKLKFLALSAHQGAYTRDRLIQKYTTTVDKYGAVDKDFNEGQPIHGFGQKLIRILQERKNCSFLWHSMPTMLLILGEN